ncbi:hypothetical protein NW754_003625 [Fusarium falciforme]|uniref:Spermine/spermidine synthase n=1 Tax=Fusarium falciforme TaxID=195108 RepID=A0A9W8RAC9_9HYPO|nr:hypothetical protein NW754_003625 [Fusarium falciforme]KAJ4192616.1 hypothetical protein NW755_003763 [Fusarium falciforme]KAJ4210593.1 hypothetical protein NW767_000866 [Fusarium falciforme]KAJ4250393.1 hypothetical protein NW757_007224 [Fusarium falciforme]
MAPKKTSKATGAPEGFTPERFERELKDLAAKAKEDTWTRRAAKQTSIYLQTAFILGLLGVASSVSQLNLSPVYGSIPSAVTHAPVIMAGCFVGWAGNLFLRNVLPLPTAQLLPIIALNVPAIQYLAGGFSDRLGCWWGPLVTEALTLFPLAVFSAACVADQLEDANLSMLPGFVAEAAPGIGSWAFFRLAERIANEKLQGLIGSAFWFTRVGLELVLAGIYAVFSPSKYLVLAIPALLHTAVLNTHVMTPMATASLNSTLAAQNWTLLERKESLTGYISILENLGQGFRVMRCDHSLLGGEWVRIQGQKVSEPIYGVFVMLEAVRLIQRETPLPDAEAKALVVGLGIGTTPSALVSHGIDTTVVEIDPVVHEFAQKYFNMRQNNPPAIADAVSYTANLVNQSKSYDYIVHDVFTGGAEPVDLFTLEFLQGLGALLKPDGVIAINYAGDFSLPAPQLIYRTIKQVFPSCRIFRESPREEANVERWGSDFTNMVIFCRKTPGDIAFRRPVPSDFLRSRARQAFLAPQHEVREQEFLDSDDTDVLAKNRTGKVTKWHQKSAAGHWKIMRSVLPGKIWEQW